MTRNESVAEKRPLRVDPDEFRPDPHVGFAKYRPVAGLIDFGGGMPFVTRHADVAALMTDPRTRQIETEGLEAAGLTSGGLHDFFANSLLTSNPPAHARRRRPVARAFAHKLIEAWRPRVRALAAELVETAAAQGEFDFLETVASPLPSRLIAEVIGAPEQDAPRFAARVYAMSRGLGAFRETDLPAIEQGAQELYAYVRALLEDRRARPQEDFLTDYLRKAAEGDALSELETLTQVVSLMIGGSDTTRFNLTAMIGLLLTHRDQWEAVCADPAGRAPGAVIEALRHEPAVGAIGRVVAERLDVDGIPVQPGTVLNLSILSAQRDAAVYAEPQRFDIFRDDHPRLSVTFGYGPHRCLGEALARAEMEEALIVLAERLPKLRLAGPTPQPRGHSGIRGISSLMLAAA